MANKCENCTEKCPQAEMAHQAALGRMYATKEFTALLKKVESGELVEVVRCERCIHSLGDGWICGGPDFTMPSHPTYPDAFCSYGERKDNG